jgi:hypothetical protein
MTADIIKLNQSQMSWNKDIHTNIEDSRANKSIEDPDLAAYLISHLQPFCENCGTRDTPQWRKGWYSKVLNRHHLLCNACGIRYNKQQFCPLCGYIYAKDKEAKNTREDYYLACQACDRWTHLDCAKQIGEISPDADGSNCDWYYCPDCKAKMARLPTS